MIIAFLVFMIVTTPILLAWNLCLSYRRRKIRILPAIKYQKVHNVRGFLRFIRQIEKGRNVDWDL